MKLAWGLSLGFALTATALGQHGASGGHAASAQGGGGFSSGRSFSMSAPGTAHTYGSAPAYRPNLTPQYGARYSSPVGPPPSGATQPNNGHHYSYPNGNYRPYYSRGVYLVPSYLSYGVYGYPGYGDYGDAQPAAQAVPDVNAQAPGPAGGYDSGYEGAYGQVPPRQPYQPQASAPAAEVPDPPEITLLFKDGRAPQQVQNYAVTRTTLYVLDGTKRREIPLNEIDLPQTEKTNRDAGVDFEVPAIAN